MKKLLCIVLSVMMLVPVMTIHAVAQGGEWTDLDGNVYTWSLDADGVFTVGVTSNNTSETYGKINTSGNVNQNGSFSSGSYSGSAIRPWHSIRNEIKTVIIDPSITQLGREMFTDCNSIETVTLPGTIKNYQWGVFSYCSGLKTVIFEEGAVNLGESKMFIGCENLRQVYVPSTVTSILTNTFDSCSGVELMYADGASNASTIQSAASSMTTATSVVYGKISDAEGNADSILWTIDMEAKKLNISDISEVGTGNMPNCQTAPWNVNGEHRADYTDAVINGGITKLGDNTFFDQYGNFTRNSVVIDCPLTACGTAFNNTVVTNVYFEEISGNALKSSTVINRNSKITNLYLPASAASVHDVFWRSVNNKADGGYSGVSTVNMYVPYGSAAHTWANMSKFNPVSSSVTINVICMTVDGFDNTGVTISNPTSSAVTADVIVAYFNAADDSFESAVLASDITVAAKGTVTADAPSKSGCYRVAYVWDANNNITPICEYLQSDD